MGVLIEDKFRKWEEECEGRLLRLKANEEELNRIFADLYGLGGEISPEVDGARISVREAQLSREIRSLVSYAVGCVFGRYSPDRDGLCFAGGEWDESCYRSVIPAADNVVCITPTGTEQDALRRFTDFVGKVYGADALEENMSFISLALGGKGDPGKTLQEYFENGFYPDHLRTYRKRPLYWMVSSGPRGALRALIYCHRYEPAVFGKIKSGALSARIRFLERELSGLKEGRNSPSSTGAGGNSLEKDLKELECFSKKLDELSARRVILDHNDGIRHNYALLSEVLEEIR